MKQLLAVVALATIAIFGVEKAFAAEDWDTSQHNVKIKWDDWDLEARQTIDSDKDHIQIGRNIGPNVNVQLRYVDSANPETRGRATFKVLSTDWFYFNQRIEWRHFRDSDDYGRVRPIIGVKFQPDANKKFYVEHQSNFNFNKEGESNDFKIDGGQVKVGADFRINHSMTVGPFVQLDHDKDFNKSDLFLGTNITFNF